MAFELVVIGGSLGGLSALSMLLAALPADFPLPIAIVQHRHKDTDETLRIMLQASSSLRVYEVEDKQQILPGVVYLAPADYHLLVERDSFALSIDEPVWYARPSIDVLFESAADAYGPQVIGVILTGASVDGAQGLAMIKARGGLAIVQAPATAECRIMPEAAINASAVDYIVPLVELAPLLVKLCQVVPRERT